MTSLNVEFDIYLPTVAKKKNNLSLSLLEHRVILKWGTDFIASLDDLS